jgi:small-conductance mechanosensitive channel
VLEDPEPFAIFKGFGESSLDFELRFWAPDMDIWVRLKSDVVVAVNAALAKEGITIPFPQRDVNLRTQAQADERDGKGEETLVRTRSIPPSSATR